MDDSQLKSRKWLLCSVGDSPNSINCRDIYLDIDNDLFLQVTLLTHRTLLIMGDLKDCLYSESV